ncbi:sensor histidine kinase [Veillonella intestinalis]|uniref:sensor histidine kinase n=1 Tax=Veillonella intestinalis TaxID=2941341 RepID=UPI00203D3906|nr:sensor histidine kinase [Veillonella intestinalis]
MTDILLFEMIKRISTAIVLGLVISRLKLFDRLMANRLSWFDRFIFILIFSSIAILGTYGGIPINDALANSRMIGIMAAGLVGGPFLGGAVGLVSGLHRYSLGGFTALACAISSITEGLLAGLFQKFYKRKLIPWPIALGIGFFGEIIQMLIILLVAEPYHMAAALVGDIAVPMTIANSLGLALFMKIIKDGLHQRETQKANQSQNILSIARETVRYFRKGLTPESANAVVQIIKKHSSYDAVSITDTTHVLAYIGAEANHHAPGVADHLTNVTIHSLTSGTIHIAYSHDEIGCTDPHCTLNSAIVVPLSINGRIIGSLKMYYTDTTHYPDSSDVAFAQGLADLFSTQLELTEIDQQRQLTEAAKMQALHTQINPHFLFNTLNTISSLIRTNPELARRLLIKFSQMFRFTLQYTGRVISFAKEWDQVSGFLEISLARHGDKLFVTHNIAPAIFSFGIPSLTLQPIIENSIKHGLQPREVGGSIAIEGTMTETDIIITVTDDGVGFQGDPNYYLEQPPEGHIGLSNVHHRLQGLYGAPYGLTISSIPEEGTTVTIRLPKIQPEPEKEVL